MKNCGIYKITNIKNGKIYIGKSKSLKSRWAQHINKLNKGVHHSYRLQDDWEIFGEENFQFEIIKLCPPESLYFEEHELVTSLNTRNKHVGYNIRPTNPNLISKFSDETRLNMSKSAFKRPIVVLLTDGTYLREYESIRGASREMKLLAYKLYNVLVEKQRYYKDYIFIYKELYDKSKDYSIKYFGRECKHVMMYDRDMNLLKEFISMIEASLYIKTKHQNLWRAINKRKGVYKEYIWKYKE